MQSDCVQRTKQYSPLHEFVNTQKKKKKNTVLPPSAKFVMRVNRLALNDRSVLLVTQ